MNPKLTAPEVLYHYCSSDSFFGIVTSKKIWLSNSIYSNDPNENKIAHDILVDISQDSKNDEIKDLAKKVIDDEKYPSGDFSAYVFCMSEKMDDLNQWRIYGDNGYGFVIGLRTKYFLDNNYWTLFGNNISIPNFDNIQLVQCVYNKEVQRIIVESYLSEIIKNKEISESDKRYRSKSIIQLFSSIFKHESYAEEKEWRIICFPIVQPHNTNINIKYNLHFRSSRGLISQYIKQDFIAKSDIMNSPFEIISIGSNGINDEMEIRNFLQFQGGHYAKFINKSKLKLRDKWG